MSRIYPAIDLIGGEVVRLTQGAFDQVTTYDLDPVTVAASYRKAGAAYLHIVDLDGARNPRQRQFSLIQKIVQSSGLCVQTGGGIRSYGDVAGLLDCGVDRVIIGSLAVQDPQATQAILQRVSPARITLGLDVKQGEDGIYRVATHGWQKLSLQSADEILSFYRDLGVGVVLCTDVSRDGTGTGPNFELYRDLMQRYPEMDFIASGGVGSTNDVEEAKKMQLYGIIIGKALYEKKFDLREVL
jgi:phosphoribosylformimino-5-aminoimidazole carboxamide ribotide isomerase